jgi:hypothetical protein
MEKIKKPTLLITSLGRTGTDFFAKFFAHIVPDSTSLHEPDIIQSTGVSDKLEHLIEQVQRAGVWRMVVLKALGKWTLVKLSDSRFKGILDDQHAIKNLLAHRAKFIERMPGSIYIEANIGYYGLLDVTPGVFKHHKAIYIVRDGRNWVRSHVNWGQFYGKSGIRKLFAHNWPIAPDLPHDPYVGKWANLSRFEQLCWAWTRLNTYALKTISKNPDARVFHFEKIFSGEGRYKVLDELLTFFTSLPGITRTQLQKTDGWLERKIHQSTNEFPGWQEWTDNQKKQFDEICGPLMNELGYNVD